MALMWAARGSRWTAASVVALALWASAAPTLIYPVYAAEWHLTTAVTTTVFAAYPVALIATLLLLGGLAEAVGSRRTILAGLGFLALGALTFVLAPNLALLLVGRALMGVGVGLGLGPATSVIASAGSDGARDRTGAIATGASAVGLITALLVGGATVQFSQNPLHAGYGVLLAGTVAAVLGAWFLPRHTRTSPGRRRPLALPRHPRPFLAGVLGVSAAYALGAIFLGIGAQFARDTVRSDDAFVNGAVLAISAAAIGIVALLAGRVPAPWALRLGALGAVVGQGLMITAGATHSMVALILFSLVGGAGYSLLFSGGITLVTRSAPAEHRAAATTSSAYLVAYLVQASVALAIGALATADGLPTALLTGSAIVVVLALAAVLTVRGRATDADAVPAPLPSLRTIPLKASTSR